MSEELKKDDSMDVRFEEIRSERAEGGEGLTETAVESKENQGDYEKKEKNEARAIHVGLSRKEGNNNVKSVDWTYEFAPKRIFWGVLLVLAAVALVMGRLGHLNNFMAGIGFWDVILTVFFLVTFVEGVTKDRIGEILFSAAFLINIHDELLGLQAITPWVTLGAALLGTIGLKMIFPKAGKKHKGKVAINGVVHEGGVCEESRKGNSISYENAFNSTVKYIAGDFSKVNVENAFGSMQIYFSDAQLIDGNARVNVESVFGSVTLYVPSSWTVVNKADHVFGSVSEKGDYTGDGQNVLRVDGEVVFGSLQIRYI